MSTLEGLFMTRRVLRALTIVVAVAVVGEGDARAQVAIEQSIQVAPPSGSAGAIQIPGFGPQRQFKTGSGRIRGRVVSAENGGPIRRAQVRLTGPDIGAKTALTDAEGRFEFRELPAGRFSMQATKSGYVSVQFGQTRPFESGKAIELVDKQFLDAANIAMPRGSVISGRLIDEFGDPIPDVSVSVMRQTWSNGRRRLAPSSARGGVTNDLGQFRVYGLPPGEYFVSASLRGPGFDMGVFDIEAMVSAATTVTSSSASLPKSGYAATYYPGTANAAEAQKVTIGVGHEATGIDFPLIPVRLSRVSGVVVASDGRPMESAMVTATPAGRELMFMTPPGSTRTARDGTFVFNGLPPGDYTLQVRKVETITSTDGGNTMVFRTSMAGGGSGEQESGSLPVTLAGEDVSNLMITTARPISATGRIVFEGGTPPSLSSVRITSMPADMEGPVMGVGAPPSVKDDGTFELKALPGQRMIRAFAGPGWTLKSVKVNGADVTDTGVEFKAGEALSGLEIELTSTVTAITGGVTAGNGSPLKDYTVVVFSESPDLWRLPMTRWVTGTRPDQDGRFKVQNLPAGRYYVAAVDYIPQGEWADPDLLERLKSQAKRMTLTEGSAESLDLKLVEKY
jgi:Carboxypeptidase regulatory-like domain